MQRGVASDRALTSEAPEHRGERRRFLIWSLMLGVIPPERVAERVLADVAREQPPHGGNTECAAALVALVERDRYPISDPTTEAGA